MAGIYRVFIYQTKTYAIQDQVMEVQQSVRGAMEILLRDLRMTGFDDDNPNSDVTIANPLAPVQTSDITINYEYYDRSLVGTEAQRYQSHVVRYWRDGGTSRLMRKLTVDTVKRPDEIILDNARHIDLHCIDRRDNNGIVDDQNGNGPFDTTTGSRLPVWHGKSQSGCYRCQFDGKIGSDQHRRIEDDLPEDFSFCCDIKESKLKVSKGEISHVKRI
jgi:hypothetical protein